LKKNVTDLIDFYGYLVKMAYSRTVITPLMKTKITLLSNMLNRQASAIVKNDKMNLNFGFIDPSSEHSSEFIYSMSWNHQPDNLNFPSEEKKLNKNNAEKKLLTKNVFWQVAFFPHGLHRSWKQLEQHEKDAIKSKGKAMLAIFYLLANAFSLFDAIGFDFPNL
jgi:hypothetical protein